MERGPRSPSAPLLTPAGLRFIFVSGILKAAVGLALFFGLPELDYTGTEAVTAVFLYESLAQLAFVYPARRITSKPLTNRILNWIVAATVALQVATITVPGLRTVLGLDTLDATALVLVAIALTVSMIGANLTARYATETA